VSTELIIIGDSEVLLSVNPDYVVVDGAPQGAPGVDGVTDHSLLTGRESDGHPASVITVQTPVGMTAAQAQAAIEELLSFITTHNHTDKGGLIPEAGIDIANPPSDRYLLSYDAATGKFKWLTSTEYAPQSLTVGVGNTVSGNLASLLTRDDADMLLVQEVAGIPGYDVQVTFTGVQTFNSFRAFMRYQGGGSHLCEIDFWNKDTLLWDTKTTFNSQNGLTDVVVVIDNPQEYINAGSVAVRFYHPITGNTGGTHYLHVDSVALVDSTTGGGGITTHSALSGRLDAEAHPASAITFSPTAGITSNTAQNAIAELGTTKLASTFADGFSKITVGPTQPSNPQLNDLWVDTN
jgi:hypothetical protein